MYIKILSRDGTKGLALLDNYEGLSFESCNPGGFTVADFTIHRPVTQYWADLQPFNRVEIGEGALKLWEGYIDKPARSTKPDTIDVNCLGWSARLNDLGTEDDIIVTGAANNQGSDFITNVMLADADLELSTGDIDTADHAFAVSTRFEFSPYTTYFDCLEEFNASNNYDWGVWEDMAFHWQPGDDTVNWYAWTADCDDISISPNPAALCNYAIVRYTQGGVHEQTATRQDTESQSTYGRVVKHLLAVPGMVSTADAQSYGDMYLEERAGMRVSAEFTASRIFDSSGNEQPLGRVRAGDNIRLVDWLPTEEVITQGATDIATFQIKSTTYDHDSNELQVTPTEFVSQVEVELARLQATGY